MNIKELMQNYTPNPDYVGWVTNDDYVFAVSTDPGTTTNVEDFSVVEMGITGLDSQLNPVTQDKQYIRAGQTTMKTGTQRSFKVAGDRYIGDDAQDYCLSHKSKYGTGNGVVTDYVYFNILNGKGEKGQVSIIVNSDGSGNAGESSSVDIEFKKIGSMPTEFIYSGAADLSISSSAGTETGKTVITVDPSLISGNSYKYKTAANPLQPEPGALCTTGYTVWDGTAEITATDGNKIIVVEVDTANKAVRSGSATVIVKV